MTAVADATVPAVAGDAAANFIVAGRYEYSVMTRDRPARPAESR